MGLSSRERTIKYGIYAAVILAAALLQNTLLLHFSLFGAHCFLLIPVCVIIGIGEDERAAALCGLFAGALWDMVSAQHMGFGAIMLMLMCFVSAGLAVFVFRNTFLYHLVCAAAAVLVYVLFYWLLFVMLGGGEGSAAALPYFYLPSALYTIIVTPLVYLLLMPLKNKLNKVTKITE